jgi:hypothetical protein
MARIVVAVALICLSSFTPSFAQTRGWYIVAGSYPTTRAGEASARRDAASIMLQCGIGFEVADVMSSEEFPNNRLLVYKGPFQLKSNVQNEITKVRPCRPEAFIKHGQFIVYH